MRRAGALAVAAAAVALLGCGGGGVPGPGGGGSGTGVGDGYGNGTGDGNGAGRTPPPPGADVVVDIVDDAFVDPQGRRNASASVTIDLGQTVGWTHNGSRLHTVTSDDVPDGADAFDSGQLAPGATFDVTPGVAGTYAYHCEVHPGIMLNATIVVVE